MIDLETYSLANNPVVLQIGVTAFDPDLNRIADARLHVNIDVQSCIDAGLVWSQDTVDWWNGSAGEKSPCAQAKAALTSPAPVPLSRALTLVRQYIETFSDEFNAEVWGNGISADIVWLKSAYDAAGMPAPWKFWNERDCRTKWRDGEKLGFNRWSVPFSGIKHVGVHDAFHEAQCVNAIYQLEKESRMTGVIEQITRDQAELKDLMLQILRKLETRGQVDSTAADQVVKEDAELDENGVPWDARIHSSGRTFYKSGENKGLWTRKRGVDPEYHEQITQELLTMGVPTPQDTEDEDPAPLTTEPTAPTAPPSMFDAPEKSRDLQRVEYQQKRYNAVYGDRTFAQYILAPCGVETVEDLKEEHYAHVIEQAKVQLRAQPSTPDILGPLGWADEEPHDHAAAAPETVIAAPQVIEPTLTHKAVAEHVSGLISSHGANVMDIMNFSQKILTGSFGVDNVQALRADQLRDYVNALDASVATLPESA